MIGADVRYGPVDALWKGVTVPSITREEGVRAARKLYRRFGGIADCSPNVRRRLVYQNAGRSCWISAAGGYNIQKGWARLAHDCAHMIFNRRHNHKFRPHDGGHAKLEREIVEYIIAKGWLASAPLVQIYVKPSREVIAAVKLIAIDERIARWTTKAKRAATALRKLNRQRKRLSP